MPYKINNGLLTIQDDGYLSVPNQSHIRTYRNTTQSIPSSSWTVVIFPTEINDSQSEYNPSTGYWTAKEDGVYIATWSLLSNNYTWSKSGIFISILVKNDLRDYKTAWYGYRNFAQANHTGYLRTYGTAIVKLSLGDTLHVDCLHTYGSDLDLIPNGEYNNFHIVKGS